MTLASAKSPSPSLARAIVRRTRARTHGATTRLMSPSGLGEMLKPFVFLDVFDYEGARCSRPESGKSNTGTLVLPIDPLHHDLLNFVPLYSAVRRMPIRLKSQPRGKCPLGETDRRSLMKSFTSMLIAISIFVIGTAPASARCWANKWNDQGQGTAPIWSCDDKSSSDQY
jgi:hypothetical protein